ncbi:hypothetical protein [Sphingomonas sp.]|uniref:hypothetical protein n=1 Tax=Sphingomonas sp. TaxID=28214 RepID=UPI0031E20E0B
MRTGTASTNASAAPGLSATAVPPPIAARTAQSAGPATQVSATATASRSSVAGCSARICAVFAPDCASANLATWMARNMSLPSMVKVRARPAVPLVRTLRSLPASLASMSSPRSCVTVMVMVAALSAA